MRWLFAAACALALGGCKKNEAPSVPEPLKVAAAAPELASASIALNTSGIYVGQAVGSFVGGFLIVRDMFAAMGWTAVAFSGAALVILAGLLLAARRAT